MELISLLIAETIKLVQQNQFCTNKANKKNVNMSIYLLFTQ